MTFSINADSHKINHHERKSKSGWSTSTAGMFVADKADVGQAGMVTAVAVEGLVRVWWHSVVVLPSTPFVFKGRPAGVFKGGDNMVGGEMPGIIVLS